MLAPVILFCYNRPVHTERTLQALSQNTLANESVLYVFCDGPKAHADHEQLHKIKQVKQVVRSRPWCKEVQVIERPSNMGLAASVIAGVTQIIQQYGTAIVLEDDLITSRYFLEYMNTALAKYENEEAVMQISGHQFPIKKHKRNHEAFFLPFTTSWGWATWKRAWDKFDAEAKGWEDLLLDQNIRFKFNLDGSCNYSQMLVAQMKDNSIDSWAIRWWWSVFVHNGIVIFPDKTLIGNIGFGDDATHTKEIDGLLANVDRHYRITTWPDTVFVNIIAYNEILAYFKQKKETSNERVGWFRKLIQTISFK